MSVHRKESLSLFSYGTLQQPTVQLATFGRLLEGQSDVLQGFALAPLAITDPEVVAISGSSVHTIASRTGNPADLIPGVVFSVTPAELKAADAYEVSARRVEVELASGVKAFVYVSADEGRDTLGSPAQATYAVWPHFPGAAVRSRTPGIWCMVSGRGCRTSPRGAPQMTEADDLKKGLTVLEGTVDSLLEAARVLQAAGFDADNVMRLRRELEMDVTAFKGMIADLGQ